MLPPDLVNFLLNFTKKMIVIKEIVGYNSNRRNTMNKSSEIYDIAWDLASIVDNLDDSVLNVIRKGTQGTDPNASASLELACLTLNKNIEQLKSLVASLEEITYSLEEELDKRGPNEKENSSAPANLS